MTTRRNFIAGVSATAATAALAACSSSATTASTPTADDTSPVTLRFAWWGNDVRNKNTAQVIADYMKLHPNVTITGEPGEWGTYWDKLSTQVAGGNAPDIIQMDEQYIRDYSKKGILADLSKLPIDTEQVRQGPRRHRHHLRQGHRALRRRQRTVDRRQPGPVQGRRRRAPRRQDLDLGQAAVHRS